MRSIKHVLCAMRPPRQWQLNSSPISHFNSCLGSFQKFPLLKRESSSSSWVQNNQVFSTSAQFLAFQHFLRKPFRNFFLHLNKKFWAAKSFKFVSFLSFFRTNYFRQILPQKISSGTRSTQKNIILTAF